MPDYHKLEVWVLACEISDRVVELVDTLGKRLRPHKADQLYAPLMRFTRTSPKGAASIRIRSLRSISGKRAAPLTNCRMSWRHWCAAD